MERNISKTEMLIALSIFLLAAIPMSYLQSMRWIDGKTDTAYLSQVVENIAARGMAVSQVNAGWDAVREFLALPANEVCAAPLTLYKNSEFNMLTSHSHFILYAVAPLSKVIPVNILLPSLTVGGFLLFLFMLYVLLRKNGIPIIGSLLFCLFVSVHPVWSQGMFGQIYVERFFIPLGFLFIFTLTRSKQDVIWIIFGILCILVSERVGVTLGSFMVGYTLLYSEKYIKKRLFIGCFGLAFIATSFLLLKFYIRNPDYNSFLANISANFNYPGFFDKLKVFALFNLLFMGIFAIFDWRNFLLALIAMGPNILGNIGGAEKTGWLTHYHSLYFPILVWASAAGFIKLSNILSSKTKRHILYGFTSFLIILCSLTFLYHTESDKSRFSLENLKENVWVKTGWMLYDFARNGNHSGIGSMLERYHEIQRIVPEHSAVTTGEGMMPALYHSRTIYYYPIGIDVADYAVLQIHKEPDGRVIYTGAVSYLGEDNLRKLDMCLNERMRKAGYDLGNPVIVGNIAILRRIGSIR
jgi:hypothetical protein